MKKKLAIIAVMIVCVFAACMFIACEKKHEHSFGDWQTNTIEHWKVCECGEESERGTHQYGDDNICDVCGYERIVTDTHVHTFGDWEHDARAHWKICVEDSYMANYAYHSYDVENNNYTCSVCGYEHKHDFADDYTCDENKHWYAGNCDHVNDKGEEVVLKDSEAEHTIVDGVCSVCGFTEGLEYELDAGQNYYIVKGIGQSTATDIVIPSIYKDKPVTQIGEGAFASKGITSVVIPDSVTSMADDSFAECPIVHATAPANLFNYIAKEALESIRVTSGNVSASVFNDCKLLTTIVIDPEVSSVSAGAFTGSPIENAKIPAHAASALPKETIKSLYISSGEPANESFKDFESLTEVTIDASVVHFGQDAFDLSSNIKKVNYTGSVEDWCGITFANAFANPLQFGADFYINDVKVEILEIPESVKSLNGYAFQGANFKEVRLPEGLTSIEYSAFENCTLLESVVISSTVTEINNKAFLYCEKLNKVFFKGTAEQWEAIKIDYNNNALTAANVYIFSQEDPGQKEGNYWHYNENVPTIWE